MNPIGPHSLADRRRPISIVVAGILPAVEPGILPGEKTARRKALFPSYRLAVLWEVPCSIRTFSAALESERVVMPEDEEIMKIAQRDSLAPQRGEGLRVRGESTPVFALSVVKSPLFPLRASASLRGLCPDVQGKGDSP